MKGGRLASMPINEKQSDMATKAEKEHMNAVADLGCIACRMMGYMDSPAEIHHIRHGSGMGQRASNYDVIPLCAIHHRNGDYGTAYHKGSKAFEKRYGTEVELLAKVKDLLGGFGESLNG